MLCWLLLHAGTIPEALGRLESLVVLYLSYNELSGECQGLGACAVGSELAVVVCDVMWW